MKSMKKKARAISAGLTFALLVSTVAVGVMYGAQDASAIEWSGARARLGVADPAAVKVTTNAATVLQTSAAPKQKTEIPEPVTTTTTTTRNTSTSSTSSSSTSSTSSSSTSSSSTSTSSELAQAQSILAGWIAKYPILAGSTVTIGATPNDYQAVCYYKSGRIIINPNHTASLSTILAHEVGHIIDWRDNGVIDWGENIPAL